MLAHLGNRARLAERVGTVDDANAFAVQLVDPGVVIGDAESDMVLLLAERGGNVSLAMTLAYGLSAYLKGDKAKALLELVTATDEIAARMTRVGGETPS